MIGHFHTHPWQLGWIIVLIVLANIFGVRLTFDQPSSASGVIYVANIRFSRAVNATPPLSPAAVFSATSSTRKQAAKSQLSTPTPTSPPATMLGMTFYSPVGFPFGDAIPNLQIGKATFNRGSLLAGTNKKMGFIMSSTELAALNNGDPVIITNLDGPYFFGPLDKTNLQMNEQLQLAKQDALTKLKNLRATVTDAQESASLDKAIQQVTASLAPNLWLDASHLQPTQGLTVFNAEINAVIDLQLIPHESVDAMTRDQAIVELEHTDRGLVGQLFDEAKAQGVSSTNLAQIQALLDQSIRADTDDAKIASFRDAWQLAETFVTPPPPITPTATPTPSPDSLRQKTEACVTDQGILTSLNAKIDSQQWVAFINEVEAQSDKKITTDCANQMIQIAKFLLLNPTPTPKP